MCRGRDPVYLSAKSVSESIVLAFLHLARPHWRPMANAAAAESARLVGA
jgi:hypothetical protein